MTDDKSELWSLAEAEPFCNGLYSLQNLSDSHLPSNRFNALQYHCILCCYNNELRAFTEIQFVPDLLWYDYLSLVGDFRNIDNRLIVHL